MTTSKIIIGESKPLKKYLPGQCLGKTIYEILNTKNEGSVAMVDIPTGKEITIKFFRDASIKIAAALKDLGMKRNDVISIISENQHKYFVPLIAGFYIGAELNLTNPNYTELELEHCYSITEPKIIFCSYKCLGKVKNVQNIIPSIKHIVVFDDDVSNDIISFDSLLREQDNVNNFYPEDVDLNDTCLLLFSSGTTGLPKAVMATHANVIHSLHCVRDPDFVGYGPNDVTVGFLPWYLLFGTLSILGGIIFGAKILILDKFTPDVFLKVIEHYKVTILFVVPPILQFLAKSPLVEQFNTSSLREIICGAATCGHELEALAEKRLQGTMIRQIYGLTETTGPISIAPKTNVIPGSVGEAIAGFNIKFRSIDGENKDLGPHEIGELLVKGTGVMKGYLKNEKVTKETLDVYGYVHTGDIGYYDDNQAIFIVDLLKEIIKYKGFQVPPAMLEDILLKHPGIKEAAVVGKPNERSGEVPVAFVVKQSNIEVNEQEIIDFVAGQVSDEKRLHGGVVFVEEIPKNPSGKILRRELRERFKK